MNWLFPVSLEIGLAWSSVLPAFFILFLLFMKLIVVSEVADMSASRASCDFAERQNLDDKERKIEDEFVLMSALVCGCWFCILWPAESNVPLAYLKKNILLFLVYILVGHLVTYILFHIHVAIARTTAKPVWQGVILALTTGTLSWLLVSQARAIYYAVTLSL